MEVARVSEVPVGGMKRVQAFGEGVLLCNVGGTIYATQDECGHQRTSLARGKLDGNVIQCALHEAKFDVTTGRNVAGIKMRTPTEAMKSMSPEMVARFEKAAQMVAAVEVKHLKTYKVEVKGDSIFLDEK